MSNFFVSALFFSFFCGSAAAQLKKTKSFYAQDGFCSQTIILDSSGYFFKEWGCEGRSNISFGRYDTRKNNILDFKFLSFDSLAPIDKIVHGKIAESKDSFVILTFYDRYKEPLGFNYGICLADTNNTIHEMWTDEKGQIVVNRFIFKNVTLSPLMTIYGAMEGIEIGGTSLAIYFNLPKLFLVYPELRLDEPQKMHLQLKKDGLYDLKTKTVSYKLSLQ